MVSKAYVYEALKIKATTAIDFDEFYKKMWRWFQYYGYGDPTETEYRDYDGGQTLEIRWICKREVDAYVRYIITVDFFPVGIKEVEVEQGGVKTKLQRAAYELRITAYVEKNKKTFSGVLQKLHELYEKYIVKERMERYEMELKSEVDGFIGEVKSFFGLYGAVV